MDSKLVKLDCAILNDSNDKYGKHAVYQTVRITIHQTNVTYTHSVKTKFTSFCDQVLGNHTL